MKSIAALISLNFLIATVALGITQTNEEWFAPCFFATGAFCVFSCILDLLEGGVGRKTLTSTGFFLCLIIAYALGGELGSIIALGFSVVFGFLTLCRELFRTAKEFFSSFNN